MYLAIIAILFIITFWFIKSFVFSSADHFLAVAFHPAINLENHKQMLKERLIIYNHLDPVQRKSFETRIAKFLRFHTFVWVDNADQNEQSLKVLIAGTAVQLTYGFPDVYLRYFKDIIIYEEEYKSKLTGQYNEGEVNAMGAIVLSRKNIDLGFADPSDGRNLVLHELAHAVLLDNIFGTDTPDFLDSDLVYRFQQLAMDEIDNMNAGNASLFRAYGATNFQEFFAVSVECFFEQTSEFMNYHPELFRTLTKLLNIEIAALLRTNP